MRDAGSPSYDRLEDLAEIRARFAAIVEEALPVGLDIETSYHGESRPHGSLHPEENYVVSVQFTNSLAWARMVPLAFGEGSNADNRTFAAYLWALGQAVDGQGLPLIVAHGAIFELRVLARFFLRWLWDHPVLGRQVREAHGYMPLRSCTLLEAYAEGTHRKHGVKELTLETFGHEMAPIKSLFPPKTTEAQLAAMRFSVLDQHAAEVIAYACEDALWALANHLERWPRVRDTQIYKLEMQVLPVVIEMADEGLCYDWARMRETEREARAFAELYLAEVIEDFAELAGHPLPLDFSFRSPDQLRVLLYEDCGMPVKAWTSGGKTGKKKPSVDAKKALPELAKKYPPVRKYLDWKHLVVLCDNFLSIYEGSFDWAADGRAHPALLQHGVPAGRFACEDPNYQQSPKKYHYELRDGTTFDFNFRECIVAPPAGSRPWWELMLLELGGAQYVPAASEHGWYILGGDYSQIELRVMAAEAGETELIASFLRGEDVHRRTAALMLSIAMDQVTEEARATGKTRNFANIYGQSVRALADQLGIPLEEAKRKDAQYRAHYPHMQPAREQVIRQARREGYYITKFGRRVTLFNCSSWPCREHAPKLGRDCEKCRPVGTRAQQMADEMMVGNAFIQGPATGDYVKAAMVRARRALRRAGLDDRVRPAMNVHDALGWHVRKDVHPAEVIKVLEPAIIYPVNGPGAPWLPMVVDWYMGTSWGGARDIEYADGEVRLKPGKARPAPQAPPEVPEVPVPAGRGAQDRLAAEDTQRTFAHEPAPPDRARHVIVEVEDMPGLDAARRFLSLVRGTPGPNTVEVRTQDEVFRLDERTGLGPGHEAQVRLIFGGALVHYDLDSVDTEALTRGLKL